MYITSTYNEVFERDGNLHLRNKITGKNIGYGKNVQHFLENNLTLSEKDDVEHTLAAMLRHELAERGIIVPIQNKNSEREYLESLEKFSSSSAGFFHAPFLDQSCLELLEQHAIVFFGLPADNNAARPGSRFGPEILRSNSWNFSFRSRHLQGLITLETGKRVFEKDNVFDLGDIKAQTCSVEETLDLLKSIYTYLPRTCLPIMIGGDHSYTYHAVKELSKKYEDDLVFIQFDHHLDVQLWGEIKAEPSEPLLSKMSHSNFVSWLAHDLPTMNIFQIGVSAYQDVDSDSAEVFLKYLKAIAYQITNLDIQSAPIETLLTKLPHGKKIYISLDVDVLNSMILPTTGYPAHSGIDFAALLKILTYLIKHNQMIGMDVMEFGSSYRYEEHQPMATRINTLLLTIINDYLNTLNPLKLK